MAPIRPVVSDEKTFEKADGGRISVAFDKGQRMTLTFSNKVSS